MKEYLIIALIMFCMISCDHIQTENDDIEKMKAAYTFLFEKLEDANINLIATENDEHLNLIENIIKTNKLKFKIERFADIERGADLCYYSKSTRKMVAVIGTIKINEKKYYVSYYLGPEGGASKEIQIEKRKGKWIIVNDDERWNIK